MKKLKKLDSALNKAAIVVFSVFSANVAFAATNDIVVVSDQAYAPYHFSDNGALKGYEQNVLDEVFKTLKLNKNYNGKVIYHKEANFDNILPNLQRKLYNNQYQTNNIIVVGGFDKTTEREKNYLYSNVTSINFAGILSAKNINDSDIKNGSVCVQSGTTFQDLVKTNTNIFSKKIKAFGKTDELVLAVKNKSCDLAVVDAIFALQQAQDNKKLFQFNSSLRNKLPIVSQGFILSTKQLQNDFNSAMRIAEKNGMFERISNRDVMYKYMSPKQE